MELLLYLTILFGTLAVIVRWNLKKSWGSLDKNNEVSVKNKIVVITGGNNGIGKATALEFAKRDAHVILACRNLEKANEAVTWIRKLTWHGELVCHY